MAEKWTGARKFVRIGKKDVMPVVFEKGEVEVNYEDAMGVIKEWLKDKYDRVYRLGMANAKAGMLETAHVRRVGETQFRLWLMPMEATVAVLTRDHGSATAEEERESERKFQGFDVTPQTLHISAEPICTARAERNPPAAE